MLITPLRSALAIGHDEHSSGRIDCEPLRVLEVVDEDVHCPVGRDPDDLARLRLRDQQSAFWIDGEISRGPHILSEDLEGGQRREQRLGGLGDARPEQHKAHEDQRQDDDSGSLTDRCDL